MEAMLRAVFARLGLEPGHVQGHHAVVERLAEHEPAGPCSCFTGHRCGDIARRRHGKCCACIVLYLALRMEHIPMDLAFYIVVKAWRNNQ